MPSTARGRPGIAAPGTGPIRSVASTATVAGLIVIHAADGWQRAARTYQPDELPGQIRAQIEIHPLSGCWIARRTDRDGYGRIGAEGAHRVVWRRLVGEIPAGLVLDHREDWGCLSRACCYPGHLKMVTHRENVLRGQSFAAVNAAKEVCDHGHPFDLFNTYYRPNGHRDCRICICRRVAEYKQRQRSAARHLDLPRAA